MRLVARSKTTLAILILLSCPRAFSGTGLFVEPGLSYQNVASNIDYGTGMTNSSAVNRGFGLLARGGVHVIERFFIAADARYAFLCYEDNTNNYSANASSWDIAPVVGWQMMDWGARLFVGYVLGGALDPESANNNNVKFENPNGWRIGAGIKLHEFSVNIEWQRLHYGSASMTRSGASTLEGLNYNAEGLIASFTFPIEFN
jgi:hypothetical protein